MTKVDLKSIHARLLKVAQDELDLTKKMPTEAPIGEAGPQEVVDAVADIAEELEEVIAIIPAEPANSDKDDSVDDPDLSEDNKPENPKEKELMAQIAELKSKVDKSDLDKVANKIAELYEDGQSKYDSIMSSGKDSNFWSAQYETLTDFVKNGKLTKTHEAQNISQYLKVAQQLGNKSAKRKMI